MALDAATVMEVRQGGDDTNGGGFVTGASGTDYSQQDSAQKSGSDLAIHASDNTAVQPIAAGVSSSDIGNLIYIASGTGFTVGFYEITGIVYTSWWQLDRACGTTSSSGGSYKMGGALATPGMLTDIPWVSGMKAWVKYNATAYLMTTTTAGAGGPCDLTVNASNLGVQVEGYETTRGDRSSNKPTYDANAQTGLTTGVFEIYGNYGNKHQVVRNIKVDGQDGSGNVGFYCNGASYRGTNRFEYCDAVDCPTGFYGQASSTSFYECNADSCGSQGFRGGGEIIDCYAKSCGVGFLGYGGHHASVTRCIAHACTDGFENSNNYNQNFEQCIAYKCTGDGWSPTSYDMRTFRHCIAYGNGGYGWDFPSANLQSYLKRCAGGSNTSGNFDDTPTYNENFITLTADPFVDGDNGDFNLNDAAGGGALLRAATFTMPI